MVSSFSTTVINPERYSEEKVYGTVLRQVALVKQQKQYKARGLTTNAEIDGFKD